MAFIKLCGLAHCNFYGQNLDFLRTLHYFKVIGFALLLVLLYKSQFLFLTSTYNQVNFKLIRPNFFQLRWIIFVFLLLRWPTNSKQREAKFGRIDSRVQSYKTLGA